MSNMLDSEQLDARPQKEQDIYQRVRLLGSGSFGKAYLVKEIKTGEMFVIKQINIAELSSEEQQGARKQAKILELLDHPNIVKFKQVYGTSKMKLNIVMEYADGGDLAARIQEAKEKNEYFSQQQILSWFTQICLGIKHIHDRKIIHRDLKGQNIFLTDDNCVKIGDFGVAKVLQQTLAKAKTMIGSPYYWSPEIIENHPYSFKTDIWSLGAILYEMCALTPPFTANNIQFLALKIVKGSYANIPPQYSNDLRQLIRWMLTTNSNNRPTINQILSSPIVNKRIKSLLTESQNIKEFHAPSVKKIKAPGDEESPEKLRPPPNLLQLQQNQSQKSNPSAFLEVERPFEQEQKTKTPNFHKKAPMHKRPPMSKHRPSNADNGNLEDIMQIKATPLQSHQPVVKLPKVIPPPASVNKVPPPPVSINKITPAPLNKIIPPCTSDNKVLSSPVPVGKWEKRRPSTPKDVKKQEEVSSVSSIGPHSSGDGFTNNKSIPEVPNNRPSSKKIEIKKVPQQLTAKISRKQSTSKVQVRPTTSKVPSKQPTTAIIRKKVEQPIPKATNSNRKSSVTIKNAAVEKKVIKPSYQKIKEREFKLEINSEEFKQKQQRERQKERNIKKKVMNPKAVTPNIPRVAPIRNNKSKQKKRVAEGTSEQPITSARSSFSRQGLEEQIFEEQKCNHHENSYEEQFDPYEEFLGSSDQQDQENDSLRFSDSANGKKMSEKKNQNFQKMMLEMEAINHLVELANGKIENLPMMGLDIPDVINLSDEIRDDDSDLESHLSKTNNVQIAETQQINFACLRDQGQLQSLRITLQEVFGIEDFIYIYKQLEQIIQDKGLDLNEQETIKELLQSKQSVDKKTLRKYFRLIATVIACQSKAQLEQF